jgi:hypothetical protein
MRLDYGYLKGVVFPVFLDANTSFISFKTELFYSPEHSDNQEMLVFHWYMLCDRGMIINGENKPAYSVLIRNHRGDVSERGLPVRLSFEGQEFAQNICSAKPELLRRVGDFGLSAAAEILKSFAVQTASRSFDEIIS